MITGLVGPGTIIIKNLSGWDLKFTDHEGNSVIAEAQTARSFTICHTNYSIFWERLSNPFADAPPNLVYIEAYEQHEEISESYPISYGRATGVSGTVGIGGSVPIYNAAGQVISVGGSVGLDPGAQVAVSGLYQYVGSMNAAINTDVSLPITRANYPNATMVAIQLQGNFIANVGVSQLSTAYSVTIRHNNGAIMYWEPRKWNPIINHIPLINDPGATSWTITINSYSAQSFNVYVVNGGLPVTAVAPEGFYRTTGQLVANGYLDWAANIPANSGDTLRASYQPASGRKAILEHAQFWWQSFAGAGQGKFWIDMFNTITGTASMVAYWVNQDTASASKDFPLGVTMTPEYMLRMYTNNSGGSTPFMRLSVNYREEPQ